MNAMHPVSRVSDEEVLATILYLDPDLDARSKKEQSSEVDSGLGVFAKVLLVLSFIVLLFVGANAVPILMRLLR